MLSSDGLILPAISRYGRVMLPGRRADRDMMQQIDTLEAPVQPVAPSGPPEPADVPESTDRGHRWWPIGAVVLVVAAASLAFPAARHQWALSFVRQPTHYTALSFVDAAHLPTTTTVGTPVHLSFTVANNEGKAVSYPYVVTSSGTKDGQTTTAQTILHRSTITIPSGAQRSASISVVPVCSTSVCRVTVALPGHGESINALLNVKSPAS
jgi:Protein of unknown function (DUF1616)